LLVRFDHTGDDEERSRDAAEMEAAGLAASQPAVAHMARGSA
jgi:hypothetical protein